ncbi:MAG: hypothetical protein WD055_05510 [Candidatus Dependentiae bacterium]
MMKKQLLLSLCLMGLMSSNVQARNNDPADLVPMLAKGICVLVGGGWALERIRNSYNDWQNGRRQRASFAEDFQNVAASTLCTAMLAYAGGADDKMIKNILGSGAALGTVYLGLKQCATGAQELRLREFVAAVAACGLAREGFESAGIPIFNFTPSR